MIVSLNDEDYESTINKCIETDTCVVMIGKKTCETCIQTHLNILSNKFNNILYYSIDDSNNYKLKSKTYEFNRMTVYPFTTVFYGGDEKEFYEGVLTEDILKHISDKAYIIKEKNKNADI